MNTSVLKNKENLRSVRSSVEDPQSLEDLLAMIQFVLNLGDFAMASRQDFEKADRILEELQKLAGTHRGIAEARILWIKQALSNFERRVVEVAESGRWPFAKADVADIADTDPKNLLVGSRRIRECLCGYYTQGHKPEIEARYVNLCRRVVLSPVPEAVIQAFLAEINYQTVVKVLKRREHA